MRKLIIAIGLVFLLTDAAYSQGAAEEKMARKISELNKMGIDTVMVYGPTAGGVFAYKDNSPCYVYHNGRYLIWIHQKHNFVTLIDECYEYKILKDKLNPVADLLKAHLSEIIHEDIKAPAFKVIHDGKEELVYLTTSDDIGFRFAFNFKGYTYAKAFGGSDLTTEYYDGQKNIYYDQNQRTYLKQLYDATKSALPNLKIKKK